MALRKIKTIEGVASYAAVYRDAENDEFVVRFYENGKHQKAADYHTSEKQDALDTAAFTIKENDDKLKPTPAPFHGCKSRNAREGSYAVRHARKQEKKRAAKYAKAMPTEPGRKSAK